MQNIDKSKEKKKEDFNIIVTYAKNGRTFQSIAEEILIRNIDKIK